MEKKLYKLYWHATYNCSQPLHLRSGEMLVRAAGPMAIHAIFWQHIMDYVNTLHMVSVKIEFLAVWNEGVMRGHERIYE